MKELSKKRRAAIKAAMQDVVDRVTDLRDAEQRLEAAVDATVDGIGEYFQDHAVADVEISDDDVDAFLNWARNHADEPEAS